MTDLNVRRYRPPDAAAVWRVHERAYRAAFPADDPDANDDLHDVEGTYLRNGEFLVGELPARASPRAPPDGRLVATGGLRPTEEPAGDRTALLTRLRVDPDLGCWKHGRAMVRALERAARRRGFERIVLDTDERLPGGRVLWELEGYEGCGPSYRADAAMLLYRYRKAL